MLGFPRLLPVAVLGIPYLGALSQTPSIFELGPGQPQLYASGILRYNLIYWSHDTHLSIEEVNESNTELGETSTPKSSKQHPRTIVSLNQPQAWDLTFEVFYRFTMCSNVNNIAVALPVELLHAIFAFCTDSAEDPHGHDPNLVSRRPRYAPNWVAITYVCQHWRAVALGFRKLWSTITPDLSPKWVAAFLERSSHAPKYVSIYVGPPPKKQPKRRRCGTKRRPVQKPLMALPGEVIQGVLSHPSRIETLHLEGNTVDVVRTLKSLDVSIPLSSLSLDLWDEFKYPHLIDSWGEDERPDASLILPETIFGGSASRLRRLHCSSGLHVIFPSCVLRAVSYFCVSCSFCPNRLFASLSQMPQLEVLRVSSPIRQYSFLLHSDGATTPVNLKNLSLLVIEDASLEPLTTLLDRLLVPANVRRHLKLKLDESKFDTSLWERFSSSMREATAGSSDPLRGIHFRREPSRTSIRIWATLHEPGLLPSPWPPLDDPFSLEIHCTDRSCLYGLHTSYSISPFHRLQEFCVSLGGPSVQELFVEYGAEPESRRRPVIPHRCWWTLFSGLSALKTLHFGEGAAELLVSASYGVSMGPRGTPPDSALPWRDSLSDSVERVIVSRSAFSTRVLCNWIYYAFALPPEVDVSLLRKNVLALLSEPRWKSADIEPVEDATESLLIFLLYCRPMDVQVSELSLVGPTWDQPDGLETLERLIHMLDPDWNAILEVVSPD